MYHDLKKITFCQLLAEEIETIKLPVTDPKSDRGIKMESFPILYPHRILSFLFNEVGIVVPDEDVQAYWRHARAVGEPWAVNNPASDLHIPLGIHGDAARLFTQYRFEKLVGVFFNIVLFRPRSVRHSRFMLFSIPHEKLYKNRSLNWVWRRLAWSFNACFEGVNPSVGPQGIALQGKHLELAGTPITRRSQKFCLTEYRGDWEWHRDTWRPYATWQGIQTCFKCTAVSRGDPAHLYYNTDELHEPQCKWIREEYSLTQFVANSLKDRNLCPSFELNYFVFGFDCFIIVWYLDTRCL